MKKEYELYLRTWSHCNPNAKADHDLETIYFEGCDNYREAVKRAKEISRKIPFFWGSIEIVQVQIAAYYSGEEAEVEFGTGYYLLWKETYINGRGMGRY